MILGISVDDVASHKAFAEKHGLPFAAARRRRQGGGEAATACCKTYMGVMEMARRDTFLVDPQGRIAKHYESVNPDGHSQVVLEDIKALKAKSTG